MQIKKQARRFDLGEIRSATKTPQGFLVCPGFATRTGVFPYMDGNGKVRRELRHPDDVFDPESLKTLRYAPVTIEHPPVMITPENIDQYGKGHTTERVEVNRDLIDVDLIIENQDAIDAVEKNGMRELSSGYNADIVPEIGVYNGAPYDYRQKNIRYNHVAIVKRGRAGPEVRLRLDSADAVMQEPAAAEFSQETAVNDSDKVSETKKVVILGREVDLPSDVADVFQDYMDRFDEMRAKLAQLEENMGTRKDKKDEDINQPGVSPQVKVEQQTPDGRSAGAKTDGENPFAKKDEDEKGPIGGEKPNSKKEGGAALADEDEMDGEEDDKKDDEPASGKGGGASESDVDQLKKDMDEKQGKHDAEMAEMKSKLDSFAAASMSQGEKKDKMDSADVQKMIRARAKLERQAEKLVPHGVSKRFDSMSDKEILSAVIKHRAPKADLAEKSKSYLQSRFDSIVESLEEEGTTQRQMAGKALLGIGGGRMDSTDSVADPAQARMRMISESRNDYKKSLSASKK
jgi:hypothetical protein